MSHADAVNRHVIRTGHPRKEDYKEVHTPDGVFTRVRLSVGDMFVEVMAPEGTSKRDSLRLAIKAFAERYGAPSRGRSKAPAQANHTDLVNRHAVRLGCLRDEAYSESPNGSTMTVTVADMSATVSAPPGTAKRELRSAAMKEFVRRYGIPGPSGPSGPNGPNGAQEYIEASRNSVLCGANIHINDTRFFEKRLGVIALDTEGQDPPTIVQLCADERHVYIFDFDKHVEPLRELLGDPSVRKVVCDLRAEESQLGPIANAADIQDSRRLSLVKTVGEMFGVHMYKDKRIHFRGWRAPLSDDQIDYAAADALWTYLCYVKKTSP